MKEVSEMNITITKPALQWFKDEFSFADEGKHYIRLFARYGGCGSIQSGFSLGITQEPPAQIGAETTVDGIIFYIEEADIWYFNDHDVTIKYSRKLDEIEFVHQKSEG